jgi:RNA-directed DNA polymerase
VKALREGKPRLVRALQYILIRSFGGRALAVRRVTENRGKRTPGIDGEIWQTPGKKSEGILKLRIKGYSASPLRRTHIPKSNGKKRPLGIPIMTDRAFQALWKLALEPIAESTGDHNSYGFRNGRSVADAIEQCFTCLSRKSSSQWILEADIRACFDRISHEWLIENVPMNKKVLSQWLKAGFMEKGVFHETDEGTPQGGIISPVLANIALDGLEKHLKERFPQRSKIHFIRYADDFVITGSNKEILENEVMPCVKEFIGKRGLELSEEKTRITHIFEGFDFLGQNIRKYGEYEQKLLIQPSKKNTKNFLEGIRKIVKKSPCTHPIYLIWNLNPKIRGWANFHRHAVSKAVFHQVDFEIIKAIWKWARRRHPNKPKKWIKKRYFHMSEQGRDWCFFGRKGEKRATLFKAQDVVIKRHKKVKGEANPFDPEWEVYFENRLDKKTAETLKGRKRVFRLWQEQDGICPVCKQKLADQTQWHKHHIKWKICGGGDTNDNIVLLHPNCHRQVHSRKLKVDKPGLSKGLRKA